jgi:hypothetical protein
MPEIKSPITNRKFQNPATKDFTVTDESGYTPPPMTQQRPHNHDGPPVFDEAAMREFQAQIQPPPPQMRQMSEVEQQVLAAKRAKREGKERLSDGARRRVEMLIEMTRATRDVEIEGNLYRLQSLSSRELRDAITATAEFDGSVQFIFETRKQLLARSLIVIAGVEASQFLYSDELEARLDFIELMDHALLLRLYHEYNIMAKEVQDKYAIKTEQQVMEVMEDLKK